MKKLNKTKTSETQVIEMTGQLKAKQALKPSVNAAVVMVAYQDNIVGKDVDLAVLVEGLRDTFSESEIGDLSTLEAMLIGQATALQSIFTSLARRAQVQEYQKNFNSFLSLALKAQSQSRATIQAVIELKYPKQVSFVKQANISHGAQQVNNGQSFDTSTRTRARTEENQSEQNKLLEDGSNGGSYLDTGTTATTSRSNSTLETLGTVHGGKIDRG